MYYGYKSLSDMWFESMFIQSMGCLFNLLRDKFLDLSDFGVLSTEESLLSPLWLHRAQAYLL